MDYTSGRQSKNVQHTFEQSKIYLGDVHTQVSGFCVVVAKVWHSHLKLVAKFAKPCFGQMHLRHEYDPIWKKKKKIPTWPQVNLQTFVEH